MDIMELGAIGEFVSGVAVIGSLLFVGMQVRQSNHLAKGAAETENGRMMMDYLSVGARDDLSAIYYKVYFHPESATELEKARYLWANGMWIHMVQAMFRQHQRGLLPDASWNPLLIALANLLNTSPIVEELWTSNGMHFADDFREFVNAKRPQLAGSDFWKIPESMNVAGAS